MKSRRLIALVIGAGLLLVSAPRMAEAQVQSTSASSPAGTSTASLLSNSTTSSSSGGASAQTFNPATVGQGLVTSATTLAATSGTPSATTIPSSANPFGPNYVNYFTLGQPSVYTNKFGAQNITGNLTGTFGKYIYVANPATSAGAASTTPTSGIGFTTFPTPRAPLYTTAFAESFPVTRPQLSQVQADAKDAIARSSMLKNKDSIQVVMNGPVILLSGAVGSETERITAEGMVRMTPGVGDVQNNLVVDPSKK
jgi:hypothetical protein